MLEILPIFYAQVNSLQIAYYSFQIAYYSITIAIIVITCLRYFSPAHTSQKSIKVKVK